MDLMDVSHLKRFNKGMCFLLTSIDVFSKKAHVEALKRKTGEEMANAINHIVSTYFPTIRYVQTDRGKEFFNSKVQTVFKNNKTVAIFHH